jgi:GntR family transcriptional regulator
MEFRDNKPIYLQITDYVCEQVLLNQWLVGEKIPSVRELAVQLEVNPNTVMRTFEYLQQKEIIFTKRGLGYYVADEAQNIILTIKKEEFLEIELPIFFKNIQLLNIDLEELKLKFEQFKNDK